MFLSDKKKKSKVKSRSPKKLKKKEDSQKPKKDGVLQKHKIEEPSVRESYKNHKI